MIINTINFLLNLALGGTVVICLLFALLFLQASLFGAMFQLLGVALVAGIMNMLNNKFVKN